MAAIGRRHYVALLTAGLLFPLLGRSDQASNLRDLIQQIATSLTDENPVDAMGPFSRSFNNYEKLRDYFEGLTGSYQIVNVVTVVDEQDDPGQTTATLSWTLTLSDKTNPGAQDSRHREIHVRLVREKKRWQIVEFSPVELFDPQFRAKSGNPPQ